MKSPWTKTGVALALAIAMTGTAWAGDPSLKEVYQTAESGHYTQALSMMDTVLKNHPNSAKAHFVEAELLAHQGDIAHARDELNHARSLDPTLAFAKPSAIESLDLQLRGSTYSAVLSSPNHARAIAQPGYGMGSAPSVPWGLIGMGAAFALALAVFLKTRASARPTQSAGPYAASGTGAYTVAQPTPAQYPSAPYPAGSYPPAQAPASTGMGSGILGGLATGAAVGAGMVAGEALMHRVLGGGTAGMNGGAFGSPITVIEPPVVVEPLQTVDARNYDMGGNDFGVQDDGGWDSDLGGASGDWDDNA